ncbi:MAG: flippase-like domain-containing protein [Chloroflexota bacterium]|nr:flippase-like domain-containing protein [Chloroflexota bacterium]
MATSATTPAGASWRSRRTLLRLATGAVIGAAALYAISSFAGGFGDALDALRDADPGVLLLALSAEVLCYVVIAFELRALIHTGTPRLTVAFRAGLVNSGLGSLLPGSPAPGIALAVTQLRRHGVPTGKAALALGWMSWFSARSLLAITAIITIVAAAEGDFSSGRTGVAIALAVIIGLALALTGMLMARGAGAEWVAALASRVKLRGLRPPSAEARTAGARWHADAMEAAGRFPRRIGVALMSASAWLADAGCLYFALRAVGVHVGFEILLLAYSAGLISSALPLLPGGLGVVEAAVPATLSHYGVPLDAALAGTLAWRGIGLFLPALAGLFALASLRMGRPVAVPPG